MSRGQVHPLDAEFKRDQLRRTLDGREKAIEAAKKSTVTPEIQTAMKKLHETGEAEVVINGVPIQMTYERVSHPTKKEAPNDQSK